MARLTALLLIMTFALAACEDEQEVTATTSISGTLTLVDDESRLPDLLVTLFDPASQTAVARDVSDSNGAFEFEPLAPGTYIPVVHANGFKPLFLPQARWKIEAGDEIRIDLRLRRAGAIGPSNYRLAGTVVDKDTGEPIPNARIEMNFAGGGEITQVNWSEYVGWATTLEDTTDEDGTYWLSPVTIILNQNFDRSYPEARITAPGYRAGVIRANEDPETANVSFFTVGLTPGRDEGSITGKVVDLQGMPVDGVQVSAEWRQQVRFNFARDFSPVELDRKFPDQILIPDGASFTDTEGNFEITGLPRGFYNLRAGADTDDGWVGFMERGIEIPTDDGTGTTRLICVQSIEHTFPADGVTLDAAPDSLAWEPVPDAISYLVTITRGRDGHVATTTSDVPSLQIEPGSPLYQGGSSFSWEVLAFGAGGAELSISDRPWIFHLSTD